MTDLENDKSDDRYGSVPALVVLLREFHANKIRLDTLLYNAYELGYNIRARKSRGIRNRMTLQEIKDREKEYELEETRTNVKEIAMRLMSQPIYDRNFLSSGGNVIDLVIAMAIEFDLKLKANVL